MSLRALGLDVGLSGTRAAVVDESGALLGRGRVACTSLLRSAERVEHDPTEWIGEVVGAARQALLEAEVESVDAVGIGALGPAPVLVDGNLRPLAPAPLFSLDPRAEPLRRKLAADLGLPDGGIGQDHALPKVLRMLEDNPNDVSRVAWVLDATGFLVAALTGRAVIDPITLGDHVLEGFEQPVRVPEVLPADAIAGGLLPEAASRLGLLTATPVAVGTYDTYVDVAGTGTTEPGQSCVLLGSTLILGSIVADPLDVDGLRRTRHLGEGWFIGGWTSTAGSFLEWADEVLAGSDDGLADLRPGAGGLVVLPYLAGERAPIWDPAARGLVLGLTLNTTAAKLRRAALDGVCLSAKDIAARLATAAPPVAVWRLGGGGARKAAWVQAVADALGSRLEVVEGAGEAIPAALLALRAIGIVVEPKIARVVEPDPVNRDLYARVFDVYSGLYPSLASSMHTLGQFATEDPP